MSQAFPQSTNESILADKSKFDSTSILFKWSESRTSKIQKNCWLLATGMQWNGFYCRRFRWCFCLYRFVIVDLYDFRKVFGSYDQMIKMNVSERETFFIFFFVNGKSTNFFLKTKNFENRYKRL